MKLIFKNDTFLFELLRTMGHTAYGGADTGECITTALRIKDKDFESWYMEWFKTAERIYLIAEQCLIGSNKVSACQAYLRASNYYRTAEFFRRDDKDDPKAKECCLKSRQCFINAANMLKTPIEQVQIPFENTFLPGYFFHVDDSGNPRPTLIAMTGYDGTAEELYFIVGAAALQRGYNVLAFEGPGQGAALRENKLYFRHDWENVIIPVVDYLIKRPEVNNSQIVLAGYSLGGYLAPRAAAFEHRIAACIANSGIFSFLEGVLKEQANSVFIQKELAKEESLAINMSIRIRMRFDIGLRWAMLNGLLTFNVATPHQLMKQYQKFTLAGIADKIQCPTLVCDSQGEQFFGDQAKKLFQNLNCFKEFMIFTEEEGAGLHCQGGAQLLANQRIFDWLDKVLSF